MELADLRTLLVVSEQGSFSRAADLLHRTQPAVSLAVRRLEQRIGTTLFTRETKRPELTEAGRVLVGYAQQMCRVQREARAALAQLRSLARGAVHVGVDETLVGPLLPVLRDYHAQHPAIRVDLVPPAGADVLAPVSRGELDLAVVHEDVPGERFEAVTIGRERLVAVVPAGHALARRSSVGFAEIAAEVLVELSRPERGPSATAGLAARLGVTLRVGVGLPSLDAVKQAVGQGFGVAVLPSGAVAAEVTGGRLCAVGIDEALAPSPVWLVRSRQREPSAAAEALMDEARRQGRRALAIPTCASLAPAVTHPN
jgi:DNA-binding transcriptional LysR family regulator